jgi:hypothetical protein
MGIEGQVVQLHSAKSGTASVIAQQRTCGRVCVVATFGEARSNPYETNIGEKKAQVSPNVDGRRGERSGLPHKPFTWCRGGKGDSINRQL